ncbi:MAG: hypothetical protein ABI310_02745 [Microbacteriaceae bacterium]
MLRWADARGWADRDDDRLSSLSDSERERLVSMRRADADRFALGRILLRELVAELGSVASGADIAAGSVAIDAVCATCGGPHGKPIVTAPAALRGRIHVSVAHCDSLVFAAAAQREPIGVDAELATLSEHATEHADSATWTAPRRWTQVEAVLKADGRGLLVDPDTVQLEHSGSALLARIGTEPARYALTEFTIDEPSRDRVVLISIASRDGATRTDQFTSAARVVG